MSKALEFREEEAAGVRLSVMVRFGALVVVNLFTVFFWGDLWSQPFSEFLASESFLELLYDMANTIPFFLIGLMQLLFVRFKGRRRWILYLAILLDTVFLVIVAILPTPFDDTDIPTAILLRTSYFNYYYLMAACVALIYSPWLMVWLGICVAFSWNSLAIWLDTRPEALQVTTEQVAGANNQELLAIYLNPNFVDTGKAFEETIIYLIAIGSLAVAVARARKLVRSRVEAERQRSSLARYFSPKVASRLVEQGGDVGQAQQRKVAILFADIVGFTGLTEGKAPEAVLDLLQDFHTRMEAQVFDHDGTLEKYIGDALLATFGTPEPGAQDATDALRCAIAMQREIDAWNADRSADGLPPVRVCIGLHFGEAVMGNIGRDRNMAFVVVGGSVNIASRLQAMGRDLKASIVISEAMADQIERETDSGPVLLVGFNRLAAQRLRGMQMSTDLRYHPVGKGLEP